MRPVRDTNTVSAISITTVAALEAILDTRTVPRTSTGAATAQIAALASFLPAHLYASAASGSRGQVPPNGSSLSHTEDRTQR